MIKIELKIEYVDGTTRSLSVRPITQVAFERHWKKGLAALGEDTHVEHLYWLAWDSLRKLGEKPVEFDPWLDTINAVDVVNQDDDEDDSDPKVSSV